MMGLVEVVATPKTNTEVFTATMNWVKKKSEKIQLLVKIHQDLLLIDC